MKKQQYNSLRRKSEYEWFQIKWTERNKKGVYDFLISFITENGYAPSVKEISKGTGIKSTSTVHYHLEVLDKVGKIKVKPNTSGGIKLVDYEFRKIGT